MGIQPVELEVKEGVRGNVWGTHGDRGKGAHREQARLDKGGWWVRGSSWRTVAHPGMWGRGRTEDWLLPSFPPPLFREVTVTAGWSGLGWGRANRGPGEGNPQGWGKGRKSWNWGVGCSTGRAGKVWNQG